MVEEKLGRWRRLLMVVVVVVVVVVVGVGGRSLLGVNFADLGLLT